MSGSTRWASAVIDQLCASKAHGLRFTDAWKLALAKYPQRNDGMAPRTLFPVRDDVEEISMEDFLHDVCWAAWHRYVGEESGQGRALARFSPQMLEALSDSSEPAARARPLAA